MPLDPTEHVGLAWHVALDFRSVADFENLACEALLALVRVAPAFDESRGFRPSTLLVPAIRNACINEMRRQRKRKGEVALYVVTDEGEEQERPDLPVVEPEAVERVLAREVREAVGRLPEREREIVTRRYGLEDGEPATAPEVGDLVGLCQQRVRQVAARGVEQLRKNMTRTSRTTPDRRAREAR